MTDYDLPFAKAFQPVDAERWRALATAALKGQPFEKLMGKSYDGLTIDPLYPAARHAAPQPGRAEQGRWAILGRLDHPDAAIANELALTDLENGATGLQIVFAESVGAYGFGLPSGDDASLTRALDQIVLEAGIAIEIDAPGAGHETALSLARLVAARKIDPQETKISFGLDPVGAIARGAVQEPYSALAPKFIEAVNSLMAAGFAGPFCVADARPVHAAGGAEAQELAFALGSALQMLRTLEASGLPLDIARKAISFRMAVDSDEFLGIAKLRALRRLMAQVDAACGLAPHPLAIHAETAWRTTARRDPYVNMLRASVAVFSAAIGGADRISVLPFTQAIGLPDAFARRAARNTQLVLLEESNLDKVADPAAGAGGFEALTEMLCDKAWTLLQDGEKAGGLAAQLASGAFQADIARVANERKRNIARRKDAITGVSEFPDIAEKTAEVLIPAPPPVASPVGALAPMRVAEPFEAMREKSDAALARSGVRPRVFLANLGPISAFTPRASFAKNFLEAGGFETLSNDGFANAINAADAFAQSGALIACLCSSDALYDALATETAKALKARGAKTVLLAGKPGEAEPALRQAGVDAFVFAGGDILAELETLWKITT